MSVQFPKGVVLAILQLYRGGANGKYNQEKNSGLSNAADFVTIRR